MTGSMLILALVGAAAQPFRTQESPAADFVAQSTELRCGSTTLRISGYGGRRPSAGLATITFNRAPLRGEVGERLRRDLSDVYAVYRLTGRCSGRTGIIFHLYAARRDAEGTIRYRSGRAYINNRRVIEYDGFEETSASSFWFR